MAQRMMQGGMGSVWCLVLLLAGLQLMCCLAGEMESPLVVLDGYTYNSTLRSGGSVSLGTQLILVCRVVGVPYGVPLSYTWTCPKKVNEVGDRGRKIYNEHILVVNTTSPSDGGTYTCQVIPMYTGRHVQEFNGSITFGVAGGSVVHSEGRLIPHEFPITDLQQISSLDRPSQGRITCTVSSGGAKFFANDGRPLNNGGISEHRDGATATLKVNPIAIMNFPNKGMYCNDIAIDFFYLYISKARVSVSRPTLTVSTPTRSKVMYQVDTSDPNTDPLVAGYEVFRTGIPMVGKYVIGNSNRRISASIPVVPGAQYRITAWALDNSRRSSTAAVQNVTAREEKPSHPRLPTTTREFEGGIELNWLPPTEPNGEVHYVIYYTPENSTEQSIDTGSDLTHYNLTGLERNRVYTNIAVQAVNSAGHGMSDRSAVIAQYNHTPPVGNSSDRPGDAATIAGVVVFALVVVVLLLALSGGVVAVVVRARRRQKGNHAGGPVESDDNKQRNTKCNEDAYSYATADRSAFIKPASATASFSVHIDEGKLCDVSAEQKSPISANPEELYSQPIKAKKGTAKEDGQVQDGENEEMTASLDISYAKPDMSMKKGRRGQQHQEEDSKETKRAPTAPIPYKKHKEFQVLEKGEEDKDSAGTPPQERMFDYADLDWDKK